MAKEMLGNPLSAGSAWAIEKTTSVLVGLMTRPKPRHKWFMLSNKSSPEADQEGRTTTSSAYIRYMTHLLDLS